MKNNKLLFSIILMLPTVNVVAQNDTINITVSKRVLVKSLRSCYFYIENHAVFLSTHQIKIVDVSVDSIENVF